APGTTNKSRDVYGRLFFLPNPYFMRVLSSPPSKEVRKDSGTANNFVGTFVGISGSISNVPTKPWLLTISKSEHLSPTEKQYKPNDGEGLHLLIHPNGSKYWRLHCLCARGWKPRHQPATPFRRRTATHQRQEILRLSLTPMACPYAR